MRKWMKLVEGHDPYADQPSPDRVEDSTDDQDWDTLVHSYLADFHDTLKNLHNRASIEAVYDHVVDGIPFEAAITGVAKRDGLDPLDLRAMVVHDYKIMRGRPQTYASPLGHHLVSELNPIIRESLDKALEAEALLEYKSLKAGAYVSRGGETLKVIRAEHDPKHHMLVNAKGDVVASFRGSPDDFHEKLTKDGFSGAMHEPQGQAAPRK
jgi:hypothetical protein